VVGDLWALCCKYHILASILTKRRSGDAATVRRFIQEWAQGSTMFKVLIQVLILEVLLILSFRRHQEEYFYGAIPLSRSQSRVRSHNFCASSFPLTRQPYDAPLLFASLLARFPREQTLGPTIVPPHNHAASSSTRRSAHPPPLLHFSPPDTCRLQ
jgi:hypothetical protein